MKSLRRWVAVKRFRLAVFVHACKLPINDPDALGRNREQRDGNISLLADRWFQQGPKPEDYGLPPDTARSKELERR